MANVHKALVVGINYYDKGSPLFGCVNDAIAMQEVLSTNHDESANFDVELLLAGDASERVVKRKLRDKIKDLFSGESDIALFYFAGHGYIAETGGYLIASDSDDGEDGIPLSELLQYADGSKAKNRVIILDSCHSGIAGATSINEAVAQVKEGTTILTASSAEQYADEHNGSGVFTTLLVDALQGAAANLVGDVSPGAVYAHIDQSLSSWEQRPVFKTNIKRFVSLRTAASPFTIKELKRLKEFFKAPDAEFQLDPSFEPRDEGRTSDMPPADAENNQKFALLQKYNRAGLVVPGGGAQHMWNAAMESKTCKLTILGKHYLSLAVKNRI